MKVMLLKWKENEVWSDLLLSWGSRKGLCQETEPKCLTDPEADQEAVPKAKPLWRLAAKTNSLWRPVVKAEPLFRQKQNPSGDQCKGKNPQEGGSEGGREQDQILMAGVQDQRSATEQLGWRPSIAAAAQEEPGVTAAACALSLWSSLWLHVNPWEQRTTLLDPPSTT